VILSRGDSEIPRICIAHSWVASDVSALLERAGWSRRSERNPSIAYFGGILLAFGVTGLPALFDLNRRGVRHAQTPKGSEAVPTNPSQISNRKRHLSPDRHGGVAAANRHRQCYPPLPQPPPDSSNTTRCRHQTHATPSDIVSFMPLADNIHIHPRQTVLATTTYTATGMPCVSSATQSARIAHRVGGCTSSHQGRQGIIKLMQAALGEGMNSGQRLDYHDAALKL